MAATDWTAGYVADVNYTYGYYTELNPLRARLPLLNQGFEPPVIETACELGFGQGLSASIHAAASAIEWWGTDFNPAQAAFARHLAQLSGSDARFFDEAFADFVHRSDLPDFDFVALHGIWSWISDDNRAVVVDFIRRKLRPGGLLYISYNSEPAWGGFVPMRRLLTELAAASPGPSTVDRIDEALDFADKLMLVEPLYAKSNPQTAKRLTGMKAHGRAYLAHEYFNRDWRPMHFSEAEDLLSGAKLSFAASAAPLDHVDAVNLTPAQQVLLGEVKSPRLREQVRDFIVNQQFRRDYWIKGPRRLTTLEQSEALLQERVIMAAPREKANFKVTGGALGEANLSEPVYAPILDLMADYKPRTLQEMVDALEPAGVAPPQIVEAMLILSSNAQVAAVQDAAAAKAAKPKTDKLNAHLLDLARSRDDVQALASPVTGGGISLGRFDQLFLAASQRGIKTPAEWAKEVWEILSAQGQTIVVEGVKLETPEQNLAQLQKDAEGFGRGSLPVLKALGIA
jgi:SAM-dependent methyltransferase